VDEGGGGTRSREEGHPCPLITFDHNIGEHLKAIQSILFFLERKQLTA
jgi:hypothetical protein